MDKKKPSGITKKSKTKSKSKSVTHISLVDNENETHHNNTNTGLSFWHTQEIPTVTHSFSNNNNNSNINGAMTKRWGCQTETTSRNTDLFPIFLNGRQVDLQQQPLFAFAKRLEEHAEQMKRERGFNSTSMNCFPLPAVFKPAKQDISTFFPPRPDEPVIHWSQTLAKVKVIRDQKEIDNARPTDLCCICMDNIKNVVLFPCKHARFCIKCTLQLHQKSPLDPKCPLCYQIITDAKDIF